MERRREGVLNQVVTGFLAVDRALAGVNPPFVVVGATPAAWVVEELGYGQNEFGPERQVEGFVVEAVTGVAACHRDEGR